MFTQLLALSCLSLFVLPSDAHYKDPRVSTFSIKTVNLQQTQTVQVSAGQAKAVCEFTYATSETIAAPKPKPKEDATVTVNTDALSRLQGYREVCVTRRIDYWDYEICMEQGVRQFHGSDSYHLGTFSNWDQNTQLYVNGAACEARADKSPRNVKVTFGCLKDSAPSLISITETQMCMYEAVVGVPSVCGLSEFPVIQALTAQAPASSSTPALLDDGSEDWVLQLSELADGRFSCSAVSNEPRASGSKLQFTKVALHLRIENLPLPSVIPPEAVQQYVARHPGRGAVSSEVMVAEYTKETGVRDTSVVSKPEFNGLLAYMKIFA